MKLSPEEIIEICKIGEVQQQLEGVDFCKIKKMEMNLMKKQVKHIITLHAKIIPFLEL